MKPLDKTTKQCIIVHVFPWCITQGTLTGTNAKTARLSELKSFTVPSEKLSVTFRVEVVATDKGA